jgi:hypothetical protein
MTTENEDLALETLLVVMKEVAPHLDEGLVRQCYEIQKKYQFSEDRALSASAMERLIDAKVSQAAGETR